MQVLKMIIDRFEDWIFFDDVDINPYFISITLLQKLSTNTSRGLLYNRIKLLNELLNNGGSNALKSLDQAILILTSRDLINIIEKHNYDSRIFITEKGQSVLKEYKAELKNASKKN
jgi:hypothetical protein